LKIRQYSEVSEQRLGYQAQADMGQDAMLNFVQRKDMYGKSVRIYIFAMVLSHSRKKYVYFQDRPYNAVDFAEAHDLLSFAQPRSVTSAADRKK